MKLLNLLELPELLELLDTVSEGSLHRGSCASEGSLDRDCGASVVSGPS